MNKDSIVMIKGNEKRFISKNYNFNFNMVTGDMYRWGKTLDDDPDESPFGPEILDIEISAIEPGEGKDSCQGGCQFCYKGNNLQGTIHHMTLDEFKNILDKMPPTLTQVAFGICDVSGPTSNPDFIAMMEYCREKLIIPNFTCNGKGVTKDFAEKISKLCGAVAVSIVNKEESYDAIKMFTDAGMDQVNIHSLLSEQSYERTFKIVNDIATDSRLANMKAIVFLQYKHKNLESKFTSMLDKDKYLKLVHHCKDLNVAFGFDSCSANLFLESVKNEPDYEMYQLVSEPCESTCFSSYINSKGEFSPCSFCEGMNCGQDWKEGLDVLNTKSFMDIWHHPKVVDFRKNLLANNRNCPIYDI